MKKPKQPWVDDNGPNYKADHISKVKARNFIETLNSLLIGENSQLTRFTGQGIVLSYTILAQKKSFRFHESIYQTKLISCVNTRSFDESI